MARDISNHGGQGFIVGLVGALNAGVSVTVFRLLNRDEALTLAA